MSVSFNPIVSWYAIAPVSALIVGLTIWAYLPRMRATSGRWKRIAFGLRMVALLLCILAALRPSVNLPEQKEQVSSIYFLVDASSSLAIKDEVGGASRWDAARRVYKTMNDALKDKKEKFEIKSYQFDSDVRDLEEIGEKPPEGKRSALGTALIQAVAKGSGAPIAAIVMISDGSSNSGTPPLVAAEQLKAKLVPVMTIGVGSENAGASSRDVAVREFSIGPTVFVKNRPEIRAAISARGFPKQPIDVELHVEDESGAVSKTVIQAKEGVETLSPTGLAYVPLTPGEKRVTLKALPLDGELITSNNEYTTYLNVIKGGLRVLYIQGPNFSWEPRFLGPALDAAKEINVEYTAVRKPAVGDSGVLADSDLAPGDYDVYILADLPADHLTTGQHRILASAVEKGAGLLMLGGRSSFGPGGWADSPLARVLPVEMHPADGQLEPEGGVKFTPNPAGLNSFILRLGADAAETARIWASLAPMTGANRFGNPKPLALSLALAEKTNESLMLSLEVGRSRVIAFGGETWPWARGSDEGRTAHLRFWRQTILWLAHKEDQGDNEVDLSLDSRRLAARQKLELTVSARDPKKDPIPGVKFETTVVRVGDETKTEPVQLYAQGDEYRGTHFASDQPGEYRVTVVGTKDGREIGRDSSRFIVYQDDRELENPAADLALLRQIAEITGGRALKPEDVGEFLKKFDSSKSTNTSFTEYRIWDNWPFLLVFAVVLSVEWWLRKRNGWV